METLHPLAGTGTRSELLWGDRELFHRRHEKSASALVAIARSLARELPLGGAEREFLSDYAEVERADPECFTRVWTDPTAYFWVRIAYQLVGTLVGGTPLPQAGIDYCRALGVDGPEPALRCHLDAFKRFRLAIAHAEGTDCEFETPLVQRLPFALPGSRLSLRGPDEVEISGLRGGALQLSFGGRTRSLPVEPGVREGLQIYECPSLDLDGSELRLQVDAYAHLTGIAFAESVLKTGLEFQEQHVALVRETLDLIEAHQPDCFAQFRDTMQILVMKPRRRREFTNLTHSDLPGAFVASAVYNPYELADTFIHEFHHNRLFFLEEAGPFFDDVDQESLANTDYYTPWRDDHRPLHGLLHAVYVHQPVWMFWCNVRDDSSADRATRDYAGERVLRIALQLRVGVRQLARHARFTSFGSSIFEEFEKTIQLIEQSIAGDGEPLDLPGLVCHDDGQIVPETRKPGANPLSVRESLREHMERFAPPEQLDDVLSMLVG